MLQKGSPKNFEGRELWHSSRNSSKAAATPVTTGKPLGWKTPKENIEKASQRPHKEGMAIGKLGKLEGWDILWASPGLRPHCWNRFKADHYLPTSRHPNPESQLWWYPTPLDHFQRTVAMWSYSLPPTVPTYCCFHLNILQRPGFGSRLYWNQSNTGCIHTQKILHGTTENLTSLRCDHMITYLRYLTNVTHRELLIW